MYEEISGTSVLVALWAVWCLLGYPVLGGLGSPAWYVWCLLGAVIAAALWGAGIRVKDALAGRQTGRRVR